jgi:hypothetical protein
MWNAQGMARTTNVLSTVGSSEKTIEPGRRTKEMLKIQDDPDELLKTKGKFKPKKLDPDGCLKIKELPLILDLRR